MAAVVQCDVLSSEAIERLTGYKRPASQLRELHRQGFYRARLAKVTGAVILERPHFEAISSGSKRADDAARPQLRPPKVRTVTSRR